MLEREAERHIDLETRTSLLPRRQKLPDEKEESRERKTRKEVNHYGKIWEIFSEISKGSSSTLKLRRAKGVIEMAFSYKNSKGETYYLHNQDVVLRGSGMKRTIYFFKREEDKNSLDEVPSEFKVVENKKSGLPFLKKV